MKRSKLKGEIIVSEYIKMADNMETAGMGNEFHLKNAYLPSCAK